MTLASRLQNSALVASFNLLLALIAFLCFIFPRYSHWGRRLIPLTLAILLFAAILFLRDLSRSGSRIRALLASLLSLPVLALYGLLMVWEGPLYVAVKPGAPLRFHVQGPSGFHGLEIYGPDHGQAEWTSDDIGLVWGFTWNKPHAFPPMGLEFSYADLPVGFVLKTAPLGPASPAPLDPTLTYTLCVQPGMGMPEYYSLHGAQIGEYKPDFSVCWGSLPVVGRTPATVRIDCATRKPLPMSKRAADRLKAYQEHKISYY